MGNIYYAVLPRKVENMGLVKLIPEMAEELFPGMLTLEPYGEFGWEVKDAETGDNLFGIWKQSARKIGGKGGRGYARWVQTVLLEAIAKRLGGHMGDEGVPEKWEPTPEQFPSYRIYMRKVVFPRMPDEAFEEQYAWLARDLPPKLRNHVVVWPNEACSP